MDIAEKRVYEANAARTRLAVATEQGLAIVGISADVIGEFGLALREPVADVAAIGDGRVLAATPTGLQVVALAADDVAGTVGIAGTGARPTDAVTVVDGGVIAAGSDGVVRRASTAAVLEAAAAGATDSEASDPGASDADGATPATTPEWTPLGEATVRAADGRLLAAADGVYRADAGSIAHVGLDDVRDVAAAGPFAATAEGCFRLGPGWTEERSGSYDLVAAADAGSATDSGAGADSGASPDGAGAHLARGEELFERRDGGWEPVTWPAGSPVAGVAYGKAPTSSTTVTYAVGTDGTVCVDAGDGWRTRSIGLRGVEGCAVVQ